MDCGVASFLSWSRYIYVILKREKLEAPRRLLPPFEAEHREWAWTSCLARILPKGDPLGSHMVGLKYLVNSDTLLYDWVGP